MPNDAKLGLAVGVGLVIAFAVVYYRTEPAAATTDPAATIDKADPTDPSQPVIRKGRRTPVTSTARSETETPAQVVNRIHKVQESAPVILEADPNP